LGDYNQFKDEEIVVIYWFVTNSMLLKNRKRIEILRIYLFDFVRPQITK